MNAAPPKKSSSLFPPLLRLIGLLAVAGAAMGVVSGFLWTAQSAALPSPSPTVEVTPSPAPTPTPTPEPTPIPYDYAQPAPPAPEVEDSWFEDAVFIGDSRTDGLDLYGGGSSGDFICYKGLTSFEFDTKKCISLDGKKVTALEALSQKTYAKVYLMLGLNELGYPTSAFAEGYEKVLDAILAAQPDAVIYIQPVVPINTKKAQEKDAAYYITNEKIAEFNAEIVRLAQEKQVIFLNVSEGLVDETGEIPYDCTGDGIHFSKDWYKQWYAYIKTHTVDPEGLEEPK